MERSLHGTKYIETEAENKCFLRAMNCGLRPVRLTVITCSTSGIDGRSGDYQWPLRGAFHLVRETASCLGDKDSEQTEARGPTVTESYGGWIS